MPYNVLALGSCQLASPSTTMTCPVGGDGTTAPEQFIPARPDGRSDPIQPGEAMQLQSVQTGMWCRVVSKAGQQQIACDQPTRATATPLTYTGRGLAYNGAPFFNPGAGQPAYFSTPGTAGTSATFLPPPIPTNTPVNIMVPSKGYLRVDNITGYAVGARPAQPLCTLARRTALPVGARPASSAGARPARCWGCVQGPKLT